MMFFVENKLEIMLKLIGKPFSENNFKYFFLPHLIKMTFLCGRKPPHNPPLTYFHPLCHLPLIMVSTILEWTHSLRCHFHIHLSIAVHTFSLIFAKKSTKQTFVPSQPIYFQRELAINSLGPSSFPIFIHPPYLRPNAPPDPHIG